MSTAAHRLRILAIERFPMLTPAEEHLLSQVANGEEAHYENPNVVKNDLRQADTWGPERTIHAEVLRWLCVDQDAIRHIDPRGLSIHGARVDGTLDLSMVTIPFALFLIRCAIRKPMNLEFTEVRLLGLNGSTTQAIHGRGLVVHGDIRLRDGFDAQDTVRLVGATIGGGLDCTGGHFYNRNGIALNVDGAKIDGEVRLAFGFRAAGQVRLVVATVAGDLVCANGIFLNKRRVALDANGATVKSSVLLRPGFHARGFLHVDGTHIEGLFDCHGASFTGDAPNGLLGEAMTVGRIFDWREVTTNEMTSINLLGAEVGGLADDESSWGRSEDPDSKHLDLEGFIYGGIVDGPTDATTRLRWLARQTPVPFRWSKEEDPVPLGYIVGDKQLEHPFRPHPYQQLAKVLRERGQEADAKQVLIAKERARRKYGRLWWGARLWNGFLDVTMAHGYQPARLLLGALFFVLLGWALFAAGYRSGLVIPAKAEGYTLYEKTGQVPAFYPTFHSWMYSLDTLVPLINFGQKDYWRLRDPDAAPPLPQLSSLSPSAEVGSRPFFQAVVLALVTSTGFLRVYRWVHIGVGWLLITLGVAGITGLVRKE